MTTQEAEPQEDELTSDGPCNEALTFFKDTGRTRAVTCSDCPFPFCIQVEARRLKSAAQKQMQDAMRTMRYVQKRTLSSIADALGVSLRTVQRNTGYSSASSQCHWCRVDHMNHNVFCRSNVCTVAYDGPRVIATLHAHRGASPQEYSLVSGLLENMFPMGVMITHDGYCAEHACWEVTNITAREAQAAFDKMEQLSAYAPMLR